MICLMVFNLTCAIHKGRKEVATNMIGSALAVGLLYWGGFFR